jgi:hypothetical protein
MGNIEPCGTCGQRVEVVTADKKIGLIAEGTSYYRGAAEAEVEALRKQLRGAVPLGDVARLLDEASKFFEGAEVPADVVVGYVRRGLREPRGAVSE